MRLHFGRYSIRRWLPQPPDWQPWLDRFRKTPGSTERFTKALSLAEDLGFMSLAQAFRATGKFMEQEMILDE